MAAWANSLPPGLNGVKRERRFRQEFAGQRRGALCACLGRNMADGPFGSRCVSSEGLGSLAAPYVDEKRADLDAYAGSVSV